MKIPAGLLDNSIEVFATPQMRANCITSGRVLTFQEFDPALVSAAWSELVNQPVKHAGIKLMGVTGKLEEVERYLVCNYGGLDHMPDLVDGKMMKKEFWPCPNRGACKLEGTVCDSLQTDTGQHLTRREIEYVKLTAQGLLDKQIADRMKISLGTVTKHNKNVRVKTLLHKKTDITRFAVQNFLI